MNPRMVLRRNAYLYHKKTRVFRFLMLASLVTMIMQGGKLIYQSNVANKVQDIYFGVLSQELTQEMVEELKKLQGFLGFYPIHTLEVEIKVESYSIPVIVKGVNFDIFPIKLKKRNENIEEGKKDILLLHEDIFYEAVDENELMMTEHQKDKLMQDWEKMSLSLLFQKEDDDMVYEKQMQIGGLLKGEAQVVFVPETTLSQMCQESGSDISIKEGLLQIRGLESAAQAVSALQEAGFYVEGEYVSLLEEYQKEKVGVRTVLIMSMLFGLLAFLSFRNIREILLPIK